MTADIDLDRDRRDLRRGAGQILGGSGIRIVARVLLIVLVARLYGIDDFGRLGETIAIVELAGAFATFGLNKTLLGRLVLAAIRSGLVYQLYGLQTIGRRYAITMGDRRSRRNSHSPTRSRLANIRRYLSSVALCNSLCRRVVPLYAATANRQYSARLSTPPFAFSGFKSCK